MPTFPDINAALDHVSRQLAIARGEALGAQILASNIMTQMAKSSADPMGLYRVLVQKCDASVSTVTMGGEDSTYDELMRETARRICDESLSSLRAVLKRDGLDG